MLEEPHCFAKCIERMGTGTRDMIRRCREAGLPEPEFNERDGFVTTIYRGTDAGQPESQPESGLESLEVRVLGLLVTGSRSKSMISRELGHKEISGQLNKIIRLLLADRHIEYTLPDKPNSRMQQYRLTAEGGAHLKTLRAGRARL